MFCSQTVIQGSGFSSRIFKISNLKVETLNVSANQDPVPPWNHPKESRNS